MSHLKIIVLFSLFSLSSFSYSTNLVNSVSEIPLKVFRESVATYTQGQYLEYNEKLLTLRHYDSKGLHKEFSVELSGHSSNNSNFKAYLDTTSSAIWITDSHFDSEVGEYYLAVEKYEFDEKGFNSDNQKLSLPSSIFGEIQGFNDNKMYIVVEDTSSGSRVYNFTEYDLSAELSIKRTLSFDTDFDSRISPNGKFFITNKGIISLTDTEMRWIDSGLNSYRAPLFIDDKTVLYKEMYVGYFIGSIDENIVSPLLILSDESQLLKYDTKGYTYHNFSSSRVIDFYDSNDGLINSLSVDKINNSWQVSNIDLGVDTNYYSTGYRRTINGGLIGRYYNYSYNDDKWLQNEQLVKGYQIDRDYVFVSNTNKIQQNELYAITTGDLKNKLRKLELIGNSSYQWRDIAEIPQQVGEVKFATLYKDNIYIFADYFDETSQSLDGFSTNVIVLDIDGELLSTVNVPYIGSSHFEANIYNENMYLTSPWGVLKCAIQVFTCDDITPSTTLNGWPGYFNNFLYYYSISENKLVYYNIDSGENWETSTFEFPNSASKNFAKFGKQLRFDDKLLVFKDDGEVESLKSIDSVNSDYDSTYLFTENSFNNEKVACDDRLVNCIYINEHYKLEFSSTNSNTWERYSRIKGTLFFYDPFEEYHSLEIFKESENLIFPEIREHMPEKIEVWQYETLAISLNDYFTNISYYEQQGHSGWPNYVNEYVADSNGDLSLTLTNEHTWFEPTIQFANYTGFNDHFTMPVQPLIIDVKDINEPPELNIGVNLFLAADIDTNIRIILDELFFEPERTKLKYTILNLPLLEGIELISGVLTGIPTKSGYYEISIRVQDTSIEGLYSDFIFEINIINEAPVLKSGASLTITSEINQSIQVNFDDIFQDPEGNALNYAITNSQLPSGLLFETGILSGVLNAQGEHNINVTVSDNSSEDLSSDFTFKIQVTENVADIKSKSASSGGSLGWFVLMLGMLTLTRNLYKRV